MLDAETKRKIDNARDILVGKVPDPKSQVDQITIALIYKFMDDIDQEAEELGGKTKFFTGEFEKFAWSKLMDSKLGGRERLDLYTEGIQKMNQNKNIPQLFRDIFKDAFLPYRDPETLNLFLKEINGFTYDHSEKLGDAFEYLLSVMGSQGKAGQFRTPRHIIEFMVDVVDPDKNDTILDPACGTAGFLISAYKHILEKHTKNKLGDKLNPDQRERLTRNFVGYDISPDMVRLSRVNMYLHKFSSPQIYEYDTLTSEERWPDRFDVIMANPPFMTPKGGIRPHKRFAIQANRSELLFVDYIAEHLTPNGRAGIIVPEGIIFQSSNAYKNLRKMLVEDGYLWAVVSLPAGVFNPYSGVKTSILFLDKVLAKQTKNILFVKIENDGFDLGAQRREISKDDLPQALDILKKYEELTLGGLRVGAGIFAPPSVGNVDVILSEAKNLVHLVSKEKIAASGDYNLSGERYKETTPTGPQKWPMMGLEKLEEEGKIEFLRGQGLSKSDLTKDGKNKCIHYGEIYTLYDPVIKTIVSRTNFDGKVASLKGDVLVPATTTADAMGIAVARSINEDGVILGGDINIIRTRNKFVLSDYLALLISNPPLKLKLARFAKGANILHLSNRDLRKLKIPLPPLKIQKQIVEELDGYQKIIDGAKQIIANYKPTIKIDPEWEVSNIGDVTINLDSKRVPVKKAYRKPGPYPYYGASGVLDYVDKYLFDEKLVLIGEDGAKWGSGENTSFVAEGKYWVNNHAHVLRPKREKILDEFLVCILNQTDLNPYVTGITVPKLNQKSLGSIEIPLPSLETQKQIVARIEAEQKLVSANKELIKVFEQKIKDKIKEVWGALEASKNHV